MNENTYQQYCEILKSELIPAMGCTEPIAIALTAAKAKQYIHDSITSVEIVASGNIIKNVKSVIVPHTGGLRGIPAAAAAGIVAGNADKELEVLSEITEAQQKEIAEFLKHTKITVEEATSHYVLDIGITIHSVNHTVYVRTAQYHTGLCQITLDGKSFFC